MPTISTGPSGSPIGTSTWRGGRRPRGSDGEKSEPRRRPVKLSGLLSRPADQKKRSGGERPLHSPVCRAADPYPPSPLWVRSESPATTGLFLFAVSRGARMPPSRLSTWDQADERDPGRHPTLGCMCNDYEQHIRWAQYCKMMQALALPVPQRQSELDLPEADDVRISDVAPVMRVAGDEVELVPMTFSFPPGRPGGAPVFNFRSEGRHFANSNRCIIPASAFFEFTGRKYPKAKHRFALNGSPITAIAGIWKPPQGNHPPSFTMLTTAPGPDVAPYHSRQVVVLRPEDWGAWLHLSKSEEQLLRPLDAGALEATTVRGESE